MSPRAVKIALAVSVALNLFVLGGAVTAWMGWKAAEERVQEVRRPPRGGALRNALSQVEPATRIRVRQAMRASALAARPDFEEARTARREAVALASVDPFDAVAAAALLQRSREAEARGRARIEADSVQILTTLNAADRSALAPILSRHRQGRDRRRERGGERPSASRQDAPQPP